MDEALQGNHDFFIMINCGDKGFSAEKLPSSFPVEGGDPVGAPSRHEQAPIAPRRRSNDNNGGELLGAALQNNFGQRPAVGRGQSVSDRPGVLPLPHAVFLMVQ